MEVRQEFTELFSVEKGANQMISVGTDQYNGRKFLAIRVMFPLKDNGWGVKTCVAVPPKSVKSFITAMQNLNPDEIEKQLTSK